MVASRTSDGGANEANVEFSIISRAPVIFLNGLGDTYHAWGPFMPRFANRNRLQIDLRGQGRSLDARLAHDPSSSFRVPIHTQSADIKSLLEHLKI